MYQGNRTTVSEFLIVGLRNVQTFRIPLLILCLLIYILSCYENILVPVLVYSSICLHSPMYFILGMLSLLYLLHTTNLVPRILYDILSDRPSISVLACITQVNVLATTGITICSLYALMSYDRYVALSNPLRYSVLISIRLCLNLFVGFWLISFTICTIISVLLSRLDFCGSNIIDNVYCDVTPLVELSCSDTTLVHTVTGLLSGSALLLPLLFDISTYIFIVYIILQIPSVSGKRKAFSTCSSHLIALTFNYGSLIIIYVIPTKKFPTLNKGLSFMHIAIIPLINPVIYILRNQEFHKAFKIKKTEVKRIFGM